eukprot:scaffold1800_cov237-Pinguiococcus_pyrenoidosus.AAC.16
MEEWIESLAIQGSPTLHALRYHAQQIRHRDRHFSAVCTIFRIFQSFGKQARSRLTLACRNGHSIHPGLSCPLPSASWRSPSSAPACLSRRGASADGHSPAATTPATAAASR